nr:hypothetical protein BaRGS_014424 [Batillaria attramentaria]
MRQSRGSELYLRQDEKCSPAVLASGPEDYTDADATITGWGFVYDGSYTPSRLKEGKVKVLHPSDCSWRWGHNVNSTVHVCLKDLGNKVYGMCHGDSGGPAQVGNVVIGLASFMGSGCLTDYPSVYVRISSHIDWILGAIAELANE